MPDYSDQFIKGGAAEQANTFGENAATGASQDASLMLPGLRVPLDYAEQRAAWFQQKMAEHKAKGMPGVYGDLENTHAYQTMLNQVKGYVRDTDALRHADDNYTLLVGPANTASKGITKQRAVQGQLGFEDDTDFEKQLTPQQSTALKKTMRDNPQLLAKTQAVELASKSFDDARKSLMGATQEFNAVLTGQVIGGLQAKLQESKDKKEEIEKKIEQVKKYVGYVETGLKVVAMAAAGGPGGVLAPGGLLGESVAGGEAAPEGGIVTDWPEKVKGYAEKGEKMAGSAEGAVGTAMQLYYQKDLDALNGQITTISTEISVYQEVQAAQQIMGARLNFEAAASSFRTADEKYQAAIEDRRTSYLEIARMADASLNHGKEDKKHDFVQQVLLYMETCREARSVVGNAQTSAGAASSSLDTATDSMQHRRDAYQTNNEASGTVELEEQVGPDEKVIQQMKALTKSWLKNADANKQKLDKQEQSAQKIMGNF